MKNIKVNSNGVNMKIKYNILSDEDMRKVGFTKNYYEGTICECHSPYWYFRKEIIFPNIRKFKGLDIEFVIHIPKDGSDLDIMILDNDFCQPYDYQRILRKNPTHEVANIVNEQVEEIMELLQSKGILRGHIEGEYI